MAGATKGIFPEKTSPFLRKKMSSDTGERRSFLALQYLHRDDEDVIRENEVRFVEYLTIARSTGTAGELDGIARRILFEAEALSTEPGGRCQR